MKNISPPPVLVFVAFFLVITFVIHWTQPTEKPDSAEIFIRLSSGKEVPINDYLYLKASVAGNTYRLKGELSKKLGREVTTTEIHEAVFNTKLVVTLPKESKEAK